MYTSPQLSPVMSPVPSPILSPQIGMSPIASPLTFVDQATFTGLPIELLVELLVDKSAAQISALCSSNSALYGLCQNEEFLATLIVRKYRLNLNMIPGETITEKYRFITMFDSRYFTDPNFVKIDNNFKDDYGTAYTSRRDPNDALSTILSIWSDSRTADLHIMEEFPEIITQNPGERRGLTHKAGNFNRNFVTLLSGAIMTKSETFANIIIKTIMERIKPENLNAYSVSFRYPFVLSIHYGMIETTELLRQYYNPVPDYSGLELDLFTEAKSAREDEFDNFLRYFRASEKLYRALVRGKNYSFADYVYNQLMVQGIDPYQEPETEIMFRIAIIYGNKERVKYMMKYRTPTESDIRLATTKQPNLVHVLLGHDYDDVEELEQLDQ